MASSDGVIGRIRGIAQPIAQHGSPSWARELAQGMCELLDVVAQISGGGEDGGTPQIAFVDTVNGDNATASVGGTAFQTVNAAIHAASLKGIPVSVVCLPGTTNEAFVIDPVAVPLKNVSITTEGGEFIWTSPDGTPQLSVICSAIGGNANLQDFQVGDLNFQRSDGAAALVIQGFPNPAIGVSACTTSKPFVMAGTQFEGSHFELAYLGKTLLNVGAQVTPATANLINTCNRGSLDGFCLDVTFTLAGATHYAEGRGEFNFLGRTGNVLLSGQPWVVCGGAARCEGSFAGSGLSTYVNGGISASQGPRLVLDGFIDQINFAILPAENGSATTTLTTREVQIGTSVLINKNAGTSRIAVDLRSAKFDAAALVAIGPRIDADLRGSSVPIAGLTTDGGADSGTVRLTGFRKAGSFIGTSSTPLVFGFVLFDANYTAIVEHKSALQDTWAISKTPTQVNLQSSTADTFDVVILALN